MAPDSVTPGPPQCWAGQSGDGAGNVAATGEEPALCPSLPADLAVLLSLPSVYLSCTRQPEGEA